MSKILFVDDSEEIIKSLQSLFAYHKNLDVSYATSGEQCLDFLRKGFRGIIFMDVFMPKLTGWETISKMIDEKIIEGNVICMLTATVDPPSSGGPYSTYVMEYVTKPFSHKQLLSIIERYNSVV